MPAARHSKLANPETENGVENWPNYPFNNGKKRLTGQRGGSRSDAWTHGAKMSGISALPTDGTDRAVKRKVESVTATESPTAQITRARDQASQADQTRKIAYFTGAAVSKVERNRKGRRSVALRLSEVRNILAAAIFAADEQRPLNRHTTIHFEAAGIADPVTALRRYTRLARDWLRTQGATFAYIWVREGGHDKGEHAHILMSVPPRLIKAFARRERGWRKRIGARRTRGAFRSTPVGRSYRHLEAGMIQYGESYNDHLAEIVGYLVKGAEPRAVAALGLVRVESGGELWGKRTGMSENIGRTARRRAQ